MSDRSTAHFISAYYEESDAPMFLTGFSQSPPENFHTTEEIEYDVMRSREDVAVPIPDLSLPARENEANVYTNKRVKPPIYDESFTLNAFNMIGRAPGQNPFQDPNYLANATRETFTGMRKLENKIRRGVELQWSQVFSTGELNLVDSSGTSVFALDYQPKATHFVGASAVWALNGSTGDPLADIAGLASVLRRDGKRQPRRCIFGDSAWQRFIANAKVQTALDSRRGVLGALAPETRGQGATFQGFVWVGGHYSMELWTYDAGYDHPQTGAFTPYVASNHMLLQSEGARLDTTFGAIPTIVPPDQRVMSFLPPRFSSDMGMDLTVLAWCSPDGKRVQVSAGTRALAIPTAIDTFGRIRVDSTSP